MNRNASKIGCSFLATPKAKEEQVFSVKEVSSPMLDGLCAVRMRYLRFQGEYFVIEGTHTHTHTHTSARVQQYGHCTERDHVPELAKTKGKDEEDERKGCQESIGKIASLDVT